MNALIRSFLAVLLLPAAAFAATVRGVVKDVAGAPVAGATVTIDRSVSTPSNADGTFSFDTSDGTHLLSVSRSGYQTETRQVQAGAAADFTLRPALAESIV